jgi:hypothetical protein
LKGIVKDANAELRYEAQRPQQQRQVLKGSQRALKESVSHLITVGLKDIQNRMVQTDFKGMTSVVPVVSLCPSPASGGGDDVARTRQAHSP